MKVQVLLAHKQYEDRRFKGSFPHQKESGKQTMELAVTNHWGSENVSIRDQNMWKIFQTPLFIYPNML